MVRQHDAAGAGPHGGGSSRYRADHHGGRSAGDAGHVVVLGQPVTPVAPRLHVSAWRARSSVLRSACPASPPWGIGERSRTEKGIMARTLGSGPGM
jgi:hypothetical protein